MSIQEREYQELTGDPDHLQTMAQHYMSIADAIRKSVPVLHALSDTDGQKSKATDALKEKSGKVADDIDKAESRYRITAQALLDYVPELRQAKQDAHTAVVHIQSAQNDVDSAAKALTAATDKVQSADDTQKDDATTAQTKAKTVASTAASDLKHWQGKWHDAREARDTAAGVARNKINDVVQHHNNGLKNPTHHWWDSVGDFVSSVAKKVWHAVEGPLKFICKWAGVLSIFLGWVPILGEVLIGLAILGAAITLIEDIAAGKGWKTLLGDSLGVALAALGGGVGKYLSKLAKFKRFTAMEEVAASSNSGNKFREAFGVTRRQFLRGMRRDELGSRGVVDLKMEDVNALKASKLKVFLNDVKNPFSDYDRGLGVRGNWATRADAWSDFKSNPLGLIRNDIGGLTQTGLSVPAQMAFGAYDARTVLQTGSGAFNAVNNLAHGDFSQSGDKSYQLPDYSPDGYAISKLTGR